jgi:hypothetical protein
VVPAHTNAAMLDQPHRLNFLIAPVLYSTNLAEVFIIPNVTNWQLLTNFSEMGDIKLGLGSRLRAAP